MSMSRRLSLWLNFIHTLVGLTHFFVRMLIFLEITSKYISTCDQIKQIIKSDNFHYHVVSAKDLDHAKLAHLRSFIHTPFVRHHQSITGLLLSLQLDNTQLYGICFSFLYFPVLKQNTTCQSEADHGKKITCLYICY